MIKKSTYKEKIIHSISPDALFNDVNKELQNGWTYHKKIHIAESGSYYPKTGIILRKYNK